MTKGRGRQGGIGLSIAGFGFAFMVGAALPPSGAAMTVYDSAAAVGQWDMSLGKSNRTCRITFEAPTNANGHVDMPATCKLSLPILANVGAWDVPTPGHIDLADASGKTILDFSTKSDDSFSASGPEGEAYQLVAVNPPPGGSAVFNPEDVSSAPGFEEVAQSTTAQNPTPTAPAKAHSAKSTAAKISPSKPSAAALALKPANVAGRYSIQREPGKDTGCMLMLDDKTRAPGGTKASLAPACKDEGILIFDPVGWRLVAGRMVLTARRGHNTHLDLQADGTWLKDPKDGKPLILKKM